MAPHNQSYCSRKVQRPFTVKTAHASAAAISVEKLQPDYVTVVVVEGVIMDVSQIKFTVKVAVSQPSIVS